MRARRVMARRVHAPGNRRPAAPAVRRCPLPAGPRPQAGDPLQARRRGHGERPASGEAALDTVQPFRHSGRVSVKRTEQPAPGDKPVRYRAMTVAVFCQVFGLLGVQTIEQNGLLVLYLRRLGVPAGGTLALLSIFSITVATARIPLSHLADRLGRKRIGSAGTLLGTASLLLLAGAGSLPREVVQAAAIGALVLFALSEAFFGAGWFSVLHPLIPASRRGVFFGALRVSWQAVGIGFAAAASILLNRFPAVWMYQVVFLGVGVGALGRAILYRRLPDLEAETGRRPQLREALAAVRGLPGFRRYLVYIAARFTFTGAAIQVLALLEREALGLADGTVVALANYGLVGNIAGFVLGALLVDRTGRRSLFIGTHLAAAAFLALFASRALIPGFPVMALYRPLHFLLGLAIASFSVAKTAEDFSLVHLESKALALSFSGFAFIGGRAASRMVTSVLLSGRGLPERVVIGSAEISSYDAVVMILAAGLIATLPLLRLVPAVRHRR
mgnify:FL=1